MHTNQNCGGQKDAHGIREFITRNSISRSHLYKLWEQGLGPRFMRVGRKVLISKEAADDWRKEMEQRAAS